MGKRSPGPSYFDLIVIRGPPDASGCSLPERPVVYELIFWNPSWKGTNETEISGLTLCIYRFTQNRLLPKARHFILFSSFLQIYNILKARNRLDNYPLFVAVHKMCQGQLSPTHFLESLRSHPVHRWWTAERWTKAPLSRVSSIDPLSCLVLFNFWFIVLKN